jgi:Holliday junction resolvase RusA-like endonuclease
MSDCPQPNDFNILFSALIPVEKHAVKKNGRNIYRNRKTNRVFLGKSEKLKSAENYLINHFYNLKFKQRLETIDCGINAQFVFYFPESEYFTKKGARNQKLPDISNLYQIVEDCLESSKIISNDTNIDSHDGSQRRPVVGDQHYLEIVLTKSTSRVETKTVDSIKVEHLRKI